MIGGIFGIGFRVVLVAVAVVIERVGAWLRENPYLLLLREHPMVKSFFASPPDDLASHLDDDFMG